MQTPSQPGAIPSFPRHLFNERNPLPPRFQLFGMGRRRKLIFQEERLSDATTGELLHRWEKATAIWEPSEYRVTLETTSERQRIVEDEEGVWLETNADRTALTAAPVKLPRFDGHPRAGLLRTLHAELLINVMPFGPVPNLMVYPRPWYRDAALMLMCFEKTGNLALVESWVRGLTQVYDRNNSGIAEADNPGQLLYMISLISDRQHPLVAKTLLEVQKLARDDYICGMSDYAEHSVYQTKWLKLGLRALGLDDPYQIPLIPDSYSSLFWMDFKDSHVPGPRFNESHATLYPYLRWAEAHFYNEPAPLTPRADDFPLTWEAGGSDAIYSKMHIAGAAYVKARLCTPHTWHAAEMFLYFYNHPTV